MAKAITNIASVNEQNRKRAEIDALQSAVADHGEELRSLLHIADLLQQKGVLDAAAASLEQGDELLQILAKQAERPEGIVGIKNLIAVVQGISKVEAEFVTALFNGLSDGTKTVAEGDVQTVSGFWDMMRIIRDPDVSTGLTVIFEILKSIGKHVKTTSA